MGDMNVDLLKFESHQNTSDYLANKIQMAFYLLFLNQQELALSQLHS